MKMRKNYQRKLNKLIRQVNNNIANDDFWQGRFVFRQINAAFERFPDNSGGILYSLIRGYDKKTGYYKDAWIKYAPYFNFFNGYHLWEMANTFIVEYTQVWQEDPRPSYATAINFNHILVDKSVWRKPENYDLNYAYWKEV